MSGCLSVDSSRVMWAVGFLFQDSDGDKSDDLVVDVSNEVGWTLLCLSIPPLSPVMGTKFLKFTQNSMHPPIEKSHI